MSQINWKVSAEDSELIGKICDRAELSGHLKPRNRMNTMMDIMACHLNGTPLNLAAWLSADDFNFMHDLGGIDRNMNRTTGKLENCFLPRFSI